MEAVLSQHVEMTPGVCGGKPRIAGTRIRVMDIVMYVVHRGESVDHMLESFSHISRADVHGALAFYFDNVAMIEAQIEHSANAEMRFRAEHPELVADVTPQP